MNRHLYLRLAAPLLAAIIVLPACDDGLTDLNVNPGSTSDIDPKYLFTTGAQAVGGTGYMNWRSNAIFPEAMIQHMSHSWWTGDKYNGTSDDWNTAAWRSYYSGNGENRAATINLLQAVIDAGEEDPTLANSVAAAKIMRAFVFQRLTDMYGDVPYFEAGRVPRPRFTPQDSIYYDLLAELEEAVGLLDPGKTTLGAADPVFGGDVAKWRKFGNSMMLRVAMRLTEVDEPRAQEWAQKAISGGMMESNDDIAMLKYQSAASDQRYESIHINPMSNFLRGDDPMLTEEFVGFMQTTDDPTLRILGALYSKSVNAADVTLISADPEDQVGYPVGNDATTIATNPNWIPDRAWSSFTQPSRQIRGFGDPYFLQTYAEVALLQAEAALRWGIGGSPQAHYEDGVRARVLQWNAFSPDVPVTAAEADAYLAANPYNPATALEQIATQYWAATFFNGFEAWANWRRLELPVLEEVNWPGNLTGGQIPSRLLYPTNEVQLNQENLDAAMARQGVSGTADYTTPVWWDVD